MRLNEADVDESWEHPEDRDTDLDPAVEAEVSLNVPFADVDLMLIHDGLPSELLVPGRTANKEAILE